MKFREILAVTSKNVFIKLIIRANGMKFYTKNYPEIFLDNLDGGLLDGEVSNISVGGETLIVTLK